MNYKNEFFPFTRLGDSHKVVYLKEGATHTYEIYNTEEPVTHTITVCCNGNYGITSVKWEDKSRDQHLYLSLKRFKGKIGWNQHFNAD